MLENFAWKTRCHSKLQFDAVSPSFQIFQVWGVDFLVCHPSSGQSFGLARNRDQVDMIGHEAISDQRHPIEVNVFPQ